MTLKAYHADDIAAAMAGMLEDDGFAGLYRKASLKKEAAGPLETQVRALIKQWEAALSAGTLAQLKDRATKYNQYFAGGDTTTALQKEIDQTHGHANGSMVFGNLKSEMESLATARAADDQAAEDPRKIPLPKTGDPLEGIPPADVEKEYGIPMPKGKKADDQCAHDAGETCAACDGSMANDVQIADQCAHGPEESCAACDGHAADDANDGDVNLAVAMDFAVKHLSKVASALDAAGYAKVADYIDVTIEHIAEKRPKVILAAKKKDDKKKDKKKGDGKPGRSYKEWLKALPEGKDKEAFAKRYKGALESAKKKGMKKKEAEEYAVRTAIDKLPKKYLKEQTGVHGPGKSGPKVSKKKGKK